MEEIPTLVPTPAPLAQADVVADAAAGGDAASALPNAGTL